LGFVRLGHGFAIPTPHYTTFFCARKMLRIFLIGLSKRQLPRTLYAISDEIFWVLIKQE